MHKILRFIWENRWNEYIGLGFYSVEHKNSKVFWIDYSLLHLDFGFTSFICLLRTFYVFLQSNLDGLWKQNTAYIDWNVYMVQHMRQNIWFKSSVARRCVYFHSSDSIGYVYCSFFMVFHNNWFIWCLSLPLALSPYNMNVVIQLWPFASENVYHRTNVTILTTISLLLFLKTLIDLNLSNRLFLL